jgi:hypothetical protein
LFGGADMRFAIIAGQAPPMVALRLRGSGIQENSFGNGNAERASLFNRFLSARIAQLAANPAFP